GAGAAAVKADGAQAIDIDSAFRGPLRPIVEPLPRQAQLQGSGGAPCQRFSDVSEAFGERPELEIIPTNAGPNLAVGERNHGRGAHPAAVKSGVERVQLQPLSIEVVAKVRFVESNAFDADIAGGDGAARRESLRFQ